MGKRRTFTPDLKFEAVLDMVRGEKTVAQICRERDISESLLYKWRDAFFERAPSLFVDQRGHGNGSDPQAERIAELERMVSKLNHNSFEDTNCSIGITDDKLEAAARKLNLEALNVADEMLSL